MVSWTDDLGQTRQRVSFDEVERGEKNVLAHTAGVNQIQCRRLVPIVQFAANICMFMYVFTSVVVDVFEGGRKNPDVK